VRKLGIGLLFLFILGSQACLYIPLSEKKVLAGKPIADAEFSFIKTGVTTKADVIRHLGNPTVFWVDERIFTYSWKMRKGVFIICSFQDCDGGDVGKKYILLVQFNRDNRVTRFEKTVRRLFVSYGDHLTDWVGQGEKRPSLPASNKEDPFHQKAVVLIRISGEVGGKPYPVFSRSMFSDYNVSLSLSGFDSGGEGTRMLWNRFPSDETRKQGWTYFLLKPGTHYLAVHSRSEDGSVGRKGYWRINVPVDTKLVYAGTIHHLGRIKKFWFGGTRFAPYKRFTRNEEDLAHKITASHFPDLGSPLTVLMRPYRGTFIFKNPAKHKKSE